MKTLYKALLFVGIEFLFAACNYTDLDPTDQIGDSSVFASVESLEKAVVGTYSEFSLITYLHQSEWGADNCRMGGQSGGNGGTTFTWAWTSSSGDYSNIWTGTYSIINNINRILINAEKIEPENADEQSRLENALGEVYFLRAYAYYELLRFFADYENDSAYGIPYVTTQITLEQPGRNSVKECYDYILADCQQAMERLWDNAPGDPKVASRAAVNALLARVYFYKNDFSHALSYADAVLSAVPMARKDAYAGIWTDENNSDVIWELRRLPGDATLGTMFWTADRGSITEASLQIVDTVFTDDNDIRKNICIDKGPDRDANIVDRVIKFQGASPATNCGLCDQKMLRSSEMMMIKIEAMAQTDLAEANKLLNEFRKERYYSWATQNYSNKEDLIKEIIKERRKEFAFEGFRWFDARRYGITLLNPSDGSKILSPGDYRWIMPIPDAECQANFTIADQQNPGY